MDKIISIVLVTMLFPIFMGKSINELLILLNVLLIFKMVEKKMYKRLLILIATVVIVLHNYNIGTEYFYLELETLNKSGNQTYAMRIVAFLIMVFCFSDKSIVNNIYLNFKKYKAWVLAVITISQIATLITIVTGTGYGDRWGLKAFSGLYTSPHLYGYALIFMTLIIEWLFVEYKNKYILGLYIVPLVTAFMTGARTTLFSMILLLFSIRFLKNGIKLKNEFKKRQVTFGLIVFSIGLMLLPFIIVAVLNSNIMSKMVSTMESGNISNSRDLIWGGVLNEFNNTFTLIEKLWGHGINYSAYINFHNLNSAIWAHSDFIDIAISFGSVLLVIYTFSFIYYFKSLKKLGAKKSFAFFAFINFAFLAFSNGVINYTIFIPIFCYLAIFARSIDEIPDSV